MDGENLGEPGTVSVVVDGKSLGYAQGRRGTFPIPLAADKQLPANPPIIQLTSGDEGTWFAPEHASLHVTLADGKSYCVATWTPNDPDLRRGWHQLDNRAAPLAAGRGGRQTVGPL